MNRSDLIPSNVCVERRRICRICKACFNYLPRRNTYVKPCSCEEYVHEVCLEEQIKEYTVNRQVSNEFNQGYDAYKCSKCLSTIVYTTDFEPQRISFAEMTACTKVSVFVFLLIVLLFSAGFAAILILGLQIEIWKLLILLIVIVILDIVMCYNLYCIFHTKFFRLKNEVPWSEKQ